MIKFLIKNNFHRKTLPDGGSQGGGERSDLSLHSCVQALLECRIRTRKQFPLTRKLLALLFVVMGITIGAANTAEAQNQYIYFGFMPVFSQTSFSWNNSNTNQELLDKSKSNTQVGAFIGYAVLLDQVYLGIEGSAQFGNRNSSTQVLDEQLQQTVINSVTMNNIYVVDFRPGYVIGGRNSLIYGILGINMASFVTQQEDTAGNIIEEAGSFRKNGIRAGVGYNLGIGKYLMARVEYVFTKFNDFQLSPTTPQGNLLETWDLNPYSNEITLGLAIVLRV